MPVSLNGATSGSVTLTAPAVAGTNTLTLPAVTDTLVGLAATQTLTGKTLTSPTITGAVVSSMGSSVLTSATAQASTSGTSINFTDIPSWVKRITVMFSGVSTNGTSDPLIQLGDSGGIETTGYLGAASTSSGTGTTNSLYTTGFGLTGVAAAAAHITNGSVTISALDPATNLWVCSGVLALSSSAAVHQIGGSKTLSGTLTQVRITTAGGVNTFDAGTINIMYE